MSIDPVQSPRREDDPRVENFGRLIQDRDDNQRIISTRQVEGEGNLANKFVVRESGEVPLRFVQVRYDFADFLSENISHGVALESQQFEDLFKSFVDAQRSSSDLNYSMLNEIELGFVKQAIETCLTDYEKSFSKAFEALRNEGLTKIETVEAFTAMPRNWEQALECFNLFVGDRRMAPHLEGMNEKQKFSAFLMTRIAAGVEETQESETIMDTLAQAM